MPQCLDLSSLRCALWLARSRLLQLAQLAAHLSVGVEALRNVAGGGDGADRRPGSVFDDSEAQLDVDSFAIRALRARGERLAAVLRVTGSEGTVEARPVGGAILLGDDDIEILAHGRGHGVTEDAFRGVIPVGDDAVRTGKDDRIRPLIEQGCV